MNLLFGPARSHVDFFPKVVSMITVLSAPEKHLYGFVMCHALFMWHKSVAAAIPTLRLLFLEIFSSDRSTKWNSFCELICDLVSRDDDFSFHQI